jgi:hypothetical protein
MPQMVGVRDVMREHSHLDVKSTLLTFDAFSLSLTAWSIAVIQERGVIPCEEGGTFRFAGAG